MFKVQIFNLDFSENTEYLSSKVILDTISEGKIVILENHQQIEGKIVSNSDMKILEDNKNMNIKIENAYFIFKDNNLNIFLK